jgi:hypothetical protein
MTIQEIKDQCDWKIEYELDPFAHALKIAIEYIEEIARRDGIARSELVKMFGKEAQPGAEVELHDAALRAIEKAFE